MSCRDHHCKLSPATYVSTVQVMLSASRQTPPLPFESAVQDRPFQKMQVSAWHPPTGQSIAELAPGNGNSSPSNVSSAAYRSRLDVVLAHTDQRKGLGSTTHCVSLSDETPSCSSSPRHPLDHGYECCGTQSTSATYRRYSEREKNIHHTSGKNDPLKLAVSLPSDVLSCEAPPSWTSRLDVDLSAIPVVSTLNSKNLHASLEPCDSLPPQQGCNQCDVQMADLHASMKLYISTCSLTVKPFQADSHGSSRTHSNLLMPQLEKVPETPAGLPTGSQKPRQGFPSDGSPALQITRFHVTSSKYPGLPQQTVSRDIWLPPAVLTGREYTPSGNEVMNKDLNPELIIFQNHHSPEFRKTPCDDLTPAHHKVSKITLILATPWTAMPIQVVREFRRSSSPTIFIKTHDSDIAGPSFHPVEVGAGLSLSVNPVCCSGLLSSHWARSGLRPPQETCMLKSVCPNNLLANRPAPTTSSTHRDMEDTWCPSIAVNIATFGSGRRVVKISIPF